MSANREGDRQGQGNSEVSQSVNLKRRRLVKGIAGATPGIFTLYSGNALALASASQRCITSTNFDANSALVSDDIYTDVYQRGKLSELVIEVKTQGGDKKWLAAVPDTGDNLHWYEAEIVGVQDGVSWYDVSTTQNEWQPCNEVGGKRTFEPPLPAGSCPASGPGSWQETNTDGKTGYALFCVDDEGNVVSAYPEQCPIGTTPVNRSCWASISGGNEKDPSTWW